jgi:N-acetyl-1-D-myo-inositol-2-amino-2-deoxy-alpha-D-glucopyranoside deacetylase
VPQAELEERVLGAIRLHQPDILLTFGPVGITRHPDHIAVHRAATAAFGRARATGLGPRELYFDALPLDQAPQLGITDYPDGQPNTAIDVGETWSVKLEALRRHGRPIADARARADEFATTPRLVELLYRAWPEMQPGQTATELGEA